MVKSFCISNSFAPDKQTGRKQDNANRTGNDRTVTENDDVMNLIRVAGSLRLPVKRQATVEENNSGTNNKEESEQAKRHRQPS